MSKLDARLEVVQQLLQAGQMPQQAFPQFGIGADQTLAVMVQFTGPIEALRTAGLAVSSAFQDVAAGRIPLGQLAALAALDAVQWVEGASVASTHLDLSAGEVHLGASHGAGLGTPPTPYRGRGVLVGVIDTGIDYTHPAFRRADGSTRVLRIWDQSLTASGAERPPAGYTYGVEYTDTHINSALSNATPMSVVRHFDRHGHGTHVAGIAAGNGRTAGTFVGMAPEADLIVVSNVIGNNDFGDSVQTADAMRYIFATATALNRPVVINLSQGVNVGPHDGTSLLERALNQELGFPGRAFVVAAGNAAADAIACQLTVPGPGSVTAPFSIPANDRFVDTLDLWYPADGRLSVSITNPAGNTTTVVAPPANLAAGPVIVNAALPGGNRVVINSRLQDAQNRDNRIYIQLLAGTAASLASGSWSVALTNAGTAPVTVDAWIERVLYTQPSGAADPIPAWTGVGNTTRATVTTPATAREAIAVASYVTKTATGADAGANKGTISVFSGRGPTRDGRVKPDLAAPGQYIMSARAATVMGNTLSNPGGYVLMQGTSMASPMVAGAVALILEKNPTLRQEQIRVGLQATARKDGQTGTGDNVPNNTWGHGKIDVEAALLHDYPSFSSRNWVRIRTALYNWTEADTPPSFDISANENGEALIELAWDPQAMLAPSTGYVPLRYYNTGQALNLALPKAGGGNLAVNVPIQTIRLVDNHATWTMPQALWDGYREELKKSRLGQSTMSSNLYYRVRFNPTGAASALIWPPDASFQNDPLAQRLAIIQTRQSPQTQVAPDRAAVDAMPAPWGAFLTWLWQVLPTDNPDRLSLAALFSHRFFTNEVDVATRGKLLMLWLFGGPRSRQRIGALLDQQFRSDSGLEMTVLKQPALRGGQLLIDHLLALLSIVPHPDIVGVRAQEQLIDDVISELLDPNGQINQGSAHTCAPTSLQTWLINTHPAEYVRLLVGWLSRDGKATLVNGAEATIPPAIFQVARYAGDGGQAFLVRTNAELAFQGALLKYALGDSFPSYDANAAPDSPNGVNTVFQASLRSGVTADQFKRVLSALLGRDWQYREADPPSDALRNAVVQQLQQARQPLFLVTRWGEAPTAAAGAGGATPPGGTASPPAWPLHTVVALRTEGGRIYFKNPQYAGSHPPAGAAAQGGAAAPPRRYEDPSQAFESMGDSDLSAWIRMFFHPA